MNHDGTRTGAARSAAQGTKPKARGPARVPGRTAATTATSTDASAVGRSPSAPPADATPTITGRSTTRWQLWSPLVARTASVAAGMLALAGIGAAATLAGNGIVLPLPASPQPAAVSSATMGPQWLAPVAQPSAATAPPPVVIAHPHPAPSESSSPPARPPASRGVTADGRVVLNEATVEELTRLPGVGQKRAEAIVALRQRLKRFRSATQLLRVRGIGVKSLRKMQPHLVVDFPDVGSSPPPG